MASVFELLSCRKLAGFIHSIISARREEIGLQGCSGGWVCLDVELGVIMEEINPKFYGKLITIRPIYHINTLSVEMRFRHGARE